MLQSQESRRWCNHIYKLFLAKQVLTHYFIAHEWYERPGYSVSSQVLSSEEQHYTDRSRVLLFQTDRYFVFLVVSPFSGPIVVWRFMYLREFFKHAPILPPTWFHLTDAPIFPTKSNSTPQGVTVNHTELFSSTVLTSLTTGDHILVLLKLLIA